VPYERQEQTLTSGLSAGLGKKPLYGFRCRLKSPRGENTKGCCHRKPVPYSHIKLRFKTNEGFYFLLSHFSLSPSQRCSRSLFYPDFLDGFLALLSQFSCDAQLAAGPFLPFLAQKHQGSELLHSCSMVCPEGGHKIPGTPTCRSFTWKKTIGDSASK